MLKVRVFVVVVALLFSLSLIISVSYFYYTPVIVHDIDYYFKPGTSARAMIMELHSKGAVSNQQYFIWLTKLLHQSGALQAGEYHFSKGMTALQMLRMLVQGEVIQHQLALIEGWNMRQLSQVLQKNNYLTHSTINSAKNSKQFDYASFEYRVKLNLNIAKPNLEGLFFPDTYHFPRGSKELSILATAYKKMQKILQQEWQQRASDLPYKTKYAALIAASLIEKETALKHERAIISGILVKRLQSNMLLQFDPSVIYGLGSEFKPPLRRSDLSIDTPYNTYMHKGLPPTPIAFPSLESIHAALHPQQTDFLYFVAKGNGQHVFSKTLAEHTIAINNRD